ncbi:MAG TPA: UDP-glucose/GDP-mannose dehydrogenase family protein [Pseudomonadales bacterium]
MNISVFGLGYVGAVTSACLAKQGYRVIGVDVHAGKVANLNAGQSPIIEAGLDDLMAEGHAAGRLSATTDTAEAIRNTEISLICVGTPSAANGSLNLAHVESVCQQIGTVLRDKAAWHLVVLRSTVLPGTITEVVRPLLERHSGKQAGVGFGLCNNPEFLRESTAIDDYFNPPKTVVGADDERSADALMGLYDALPGPKIRTSLAIAEMVKYADNNWHALKISFANEIGRIAQALAIDSHEVMRIFCEDKRLNISPAYLKPGFSFGGSCLPKDVRALTYRARSLDVDVPVLNAILPSNRLPLAQALETVLSLGKRQVSVLGFAFKPGTDDLRESPVVELIEQLLGKGCQVKIWDPCVQLDRLTGANRDYLLRTLPHIAELMAPTLADALAHGDVLVVGQNAPELAGLQQRMRADQAVVDLVRLPGLDGVANYHGFNR